MYIPSWRFLSKNHVQTAHVSHDSNVVLVVWKRLSVDLTGVCTDMYARMRFDYSDQKASLSRSNHWKTCQRWFEMSSSKVSGKNGENRKVIESYVNRQNVTYSWQDESKITDLYRVQQLNEVWLLWPEILTQLVFFICLQYSELQEHDMDFMSKTSPVKCKFFIVWLVMKEHLFLLLHVHN